MKRNEPWADENLPTVFFYLKIVKSNTGGRDHENMRQDFTRALHFALVTTAGQAVAQTKTIKVGAAIT